MPNASSPQSFDSTPPRWLWVVFAIAMIFGLYGRFVGLGLWPFGVDEFYISRSIDNVLRSGLPEFPCGGFYTRGIAYQYIVAALRESGLTPEFAGRIVTAISSVCVLPAVYLLGKRLRDSTTGLLAVILLCVSVWEIEMARFARMYAPFQAVFAWYLVFFLRYVVDGEQRALIGMALLSLLGVMMWEGGALIGLLNLLPPFINQQDGKPKSRDVVYLIAMGLLFVVLYVATKDLRGWSTIPTLPETPLSVPANHAVKAKLIAMTLRYHPLWMAVSLIPLLFAAASVPWLWSMRSHWLAASGLTLVLVAALAGQILLCAAIVLLLLVVQLIEWRSLLDRRARPFLLTILVAACFWCAFGWLTSEWYANASASGPKALLLAKQLFGFPDIFDQIVRPWGGTLPRLTILLALGLLMLFHRAVFGTWYPQAHAVRAMLIVILVLALAVGAAKTPRYETRYTFFLYPILLTMGLVAAGLIANRLAKSVTVAASIFAIACLALFAASEDFQPNHVATIASAHTNFREGMPGKLASHYYPRNDVQALAIWLRAQVQRGTLVLSGVPNLDQYYRDINYVFLGAGDDRLDAYACNYGRTDRWTNKPLLYSATALEPLVTGGATVYIVAYPDFTKSIIEELKQQGLSYREITPVPNAGAHVLIVNKTVPYS